MHESKMETDCKLHQLKSVYTPRKKRIIVTTIIHSQNKWQKNLINEEQIKIFQLHSSLIPKEISPRNFIIHLHRISPSRVAEIESRSEVQVIKLARRCKVRSKVTLVI